MVASCETSRRSVASSPSSKERYNRHWRLEKLGFLSPLEARQAYTLQEAA